MSGDDAISGTGPLYPIGLRLKNRPVLVVGAGTVAARKVAELVVCGADVTVVAPEVAAELAARDDVVIERREYRSGEAAGYGLVFTATGSSAVNQQVFDDCESAGIWVNAADDPERCSFTLPARVRRGSLLVTVSTDGRSPALAAWLRERFEAEIGAEYETLLELLALERERLQSEGVATESFDWHAALASGMLEEVRAGRIDAARELLRACLSS